MNELEREYYVAEIERQRDFIELVEIEISELLHTIITEEIGTSDWHKGLKKLSDKSIKRIYDEVIDERGRRRRKRNK